MGELDLIKPYLDRQGTVFFGRLNMKPGKPTTFAKIEGEDSEGNKCSSLVFALPGNPVSSFVTSMLFIEPVLRILASPEKGKELSNLTKCEVQLLPKKVNIDPIRPEYHRAVAFQESGFSASSP
jgi:gephyrin